MKHFLALALFFCPLSGLADDVAGPTPEVPGATVATNKAHPDLIRLQHELSLKLSDKKDGRVTPEQYETWKGEFRARLDAAVTRVPPSPDNTAAHARIMAQLGERKEARATLDQALEQNPKSSVLLTTKGQILYDQNDFPAAAHNALQAWKNSGQTDKDAWALYQMSKGRSAPSGTASESPGVSTLKQGSPVVTADDSYKPIKLAVKGSARPSFVPTPGQDAAEPIKRGSGLPLWPLAVPLAGGLIGYGLYRGVKQNAAGQLSSDETPSTGGAELLAGSAVLVRAPNPESAEAIEALIQQTGKALVAKEAAKNAAKAALKKGLPIVTVAAAVTALTFGVIIAAGAATILCLDEMIVAQDKYNAAIDTHRNDRPSTASLPGGSKANDEDNDRPVYVVRAGIASAQNLQEGVRTKLHGSGIPGFSVQSKAGLTVEQHAAAGQFPHLKISVSTVARLRAAGVHLVPTSGTGYHNTAKTPRLLSDADAARISAAFDPPITNPHPVKRRSASEQ